HHDRRDQAVTARDRTILLVLAAVLALGGFWFFAIKPKRAESQSLTAQLGQQQTRLQSAQSVVASGRAPKAAYHHNATVVAELGKAIPADEDVASLVYQLQSGSRNAKVTFDSIERAASTTSTPGATPTPTAGTSSAALPPGTSVGTAGLVTA